MYTEEIIIKVLGKTTLQCPEVNQNTLRLILEEVLYDYDIQPMSKALVPISNISEHIALFLASKKLDGLSDISLYNYNLHLTRFSRFINKNVEDITAMDIRMYLAYLTKQNKLKATSIETEKSIIKSFFTWLETEDYIVKSPARKIKPTKVEKRIRQSLTVEELERLRDACKTVRQRALMEFIYSTGCRLSEVVNVDIFDINWETCSLNVVGKGNKERTVFFSEKAKLYLKKYLNGRTDACPALFVTSRRPYGRLGNRAIEREIAKIADQAEFDKSVFPHLLRHTFATLGLKAGTPLPVLQDLMGHSDPSTTQIYARIDNETVKYEYKKHMAQ